MDDKFIDALKRGKLKGRTRIILEDIETRRRYITEDNNMITGAIDKIFNTNYLGMADYGSFLSVSSVLGGVFLFQDELNESIDNIFPPSQAANKLIGHAGQTSHSTASTTRGNPNGAATTYDRENGLIRYVWDWTSEQGNGRISAITLTNAGAGDAGLYPDGTLPLIRTRGLTIEGLNRYNANQMGSDGSFTEALSKRFPMYIDEDGNGRNIWFSGTDFKESVYRHPYVSSCLIENASVIVDDNFTEISSRTATLSRSFTANYTIAAHDASAYYLMERDASDATKLYVNIISKISFEVTAKVITISGATLERVQYLENDRFFGIVSDGYIYWRSGSNNKTFVRININNTADITVLVSSLSNEIAQNEQPIVASPGLILGRNYLINGDYVYPVLKKAYRSTDEQNETYESQRKYTLCGQLNNPVLYDIARIRYNSISRVMSAGPNLFLPYLASVNNLAQPVTKTAQRTLRVEYTISIAED